jgi:hypothetical protein
MAIFSEFASQVASANVSQLIFKNFLCEHCLAKHDVVNYPPLTREKVKIQKTPSDSINMP